MTERGKSRFEMFRWISICLELSSGEFILTRLTKSNGGTVVFLRALQISALIYLAGLGAMNLLDPERAIDWNFVEFRIQLIDNAKWFAALFGGSYAALYARFSPQWSYLANVYNQTKAAP